MKKLSILAAIVALGASPVIAQQGNPGAGFLEQWDMDGDGSVTLAEAREKRTEVFVMFDMDENGSFSADEQAMIDEHMAAEAGNGGGHGAFGPGRFIHAAMEPAFNDADGDAIVTAAEFVAATDVLFPQIDRNGDGVVDRADFGPGN